MRDFSTRPPGRASTPLDVALLAGAALGLVFSVHAAWAAHRELRRTRQAAAEVRRQVEADRLRLRELEARRAPVGEAIASAALLTIEAPPPQVLRDLGGILPGQVRLESLSMTYGEQVGLELRMAARDAPTYDLFLTRVAASPRFADVLPGPENRNGEVQASLRMSYHPRGSP